MTSNKKSKSEDIEKLRMILDDPLNPKNKEIVGKDNSHLESLRLRLATDSSETNTKSTTSSPYQRNPELLKPQVNIHNQSEELEKKPDDLSPKPAKQKEEFYVKPKYAEEEKIQERPSEHIQDLLESEKLIEIEKVTVTPSEFSEVKQKHDTRFNEKKEFLSYSNKTTTNDKQDSYDEHDLPQWQSIDEQHPEKKDETFDEKTDDTAPIKDFLEVKNVEKNAEISSEQEPIPEWKMVNTQNSDKTTDEEQTRSHIQEKPVEDERQKQQDKQTPNEPKEVIVEWQPIEEQDNTNDPAQEKVPENIKKELAIEKDEEKNENETQLEKKDDSFQEQSTDETVRKEPDELTDEQEATPLDEEKTVEEKTVEEQIEKQPNKHSELENSKTEHTQTITEWESIDEPSQQDSRDMQQESADNTQSLQPAEESSEPNDLEKKPKPAASSDKTEEIFINDFISKKSIQESEDIAYEAPSKESKSKKELQRKEKEKIKQEKKLQKKLEKEKKPKKRLLLKQKPKKQNKDISDNQPTTDSIDSSEEKDVDFTDQKGDKKTFTKIEESTVDNKKFEVFKDTKLPQSKKEQKTPSPPPDIFAEEDISEWESYAIDETEDNKPLTSAYTYAEFMLYKKEVKTAMGKTKTVHFFSKTVPDVGQPVELPEGYEVKVNKKTGLPYLKKK